MDRLGDCIASQAARLRDDFRLTAVVASEIEFYLPRSGQSQALPAFWDEVVAACKKSGIGIFNIEKEKGREQHEVSLNCATPEKAAQDTLTLKRILTTAAMTRGMHVDFSARPFADQPGSGLHIHVHLADENGKNVFFKNDESISDALKYSIGGLLTWLPDSMAIFAPKEDSYARFAAGSNAPTKISWGANNRTVAIRLPLSAHTNKRIEHRVAGADADPVRVIAVILAAMHYGMKNNCEPGPQMYGDAALPQYALPPLPSSLKDAEARLNVSKMLAGYFSASILAPVH